MDAESDYGIGDVSDLFGDEDTSIIEDKSPLVQLSKKDRLVSFLFGHPIFPIDTSVKTIHAMMNANFRPSTHPDISQNHRQACEDFYACLSRPASGSSTDVEQEDRMFLARLLLVVISFVDNFASNDMASEVVLGLGLIRDLLFTFRGLIFRQEIIISLHNQAMKALFALLIRLVRQQQASYVGYLQKRKPVQSKSSTQQNSQKQASKGSLPALQPQLWQQREIDPILLSCLSILSLLAWRPDAGCLTK
jgi:hypothetical protein